MKCLAFEVDVREGTRVLGRFEVREDRGVWKCAPQVVLDLLGDVMTALHGPGAGNEYMQRDERARP